MPPPRPDLTRPFTRREGLAAGVSWRQLGGPSYPRVFHNMYVAGDPTTHDVLVHAALRLAPPGSALSHETAARLLRLWTPSESRVHLSVPVDRHRPRHEGIVSHTLSPRTRIISVRGLPTTAAPTVLVDLAPRLRVMDLVILSDSLMYRGLATSEDLLEISHGYVGPGARALRRAVHLARLGSESPRESGLRVLIQLYGFPPPDVQIPVITPSGMRYRLDLGYENLKLGIEYDGRQHAEDPRQYATDIHRREELIRAGWRVVTAVADDVYRRQEDFLSALHATYIERGGDPFRVGRTWRRAA